jgi:hypothetical protein
VQRLPEQPRNLSSRDPALAIDRQFFVTELVGGGQIPLQIRNGFQVVLRLHAQDNRRCCEIL